MYKRLIIATFDDVVNIWTDKLWPNRKSAIEPTSAMTWDRQIDMSLMEAKPTFFTYQIRTYANSPWITIGTSSGFAAGKGDYRVRGLYVNKEYRDMDIGTTLLYAVEGQAVKENCNRIWGLPRANAIDFYEKYGLLRTSELVEEGVEFGPNYYAEKFIVPDPKLYPEINV